MPKARGKASGAGSTSANVGYEAQLWQMADALRGVVKLLEPCCSHHRGRVYDPWLASSSGMFVQSVEFIRAHASGNGNGGKA